MFDLCLFTDLELMSVILVLAFSIGLLHTAFVLSLTGYSGNILLLFVFLSLGCFTNGALYEFMMASPIGPILHIVIC